MNVIDLDIEPKWWEKLTLFQSF